MFYLYCMPGKFFTLISYLWPGKNETRATGRRRDSTLAHFFYSTIFWAILAWLAASLFAVPALKHTAPPSAQDFKSYRDDARFASPPTEEGTKPSSSPTNATNLSKEPPRVDRGSQNFKDESEVIQPTAMPPNLLELDAVKHTMRKAFDSGKAERWHVDKLKGYAVPSEALVEGCRSMTVSEDNDRMATLQTKICKEPEH